MTEYALSIDSDIYSIGVVPTLPDQSIDKITVDGDAAGSGQAAAVTPAVGTSEIEVVVSGDGGPSTTYTLAVSREDIQPVVDKFRRLSFTDPATGVTMGYRLFVPDNYDPNRSYPLVMFLQVPGEGGSDDEIQLIANQGATVWAKPEEQAKRPSFVLAPQSNMDPTADKAAHRFGPIGYVTHARRLSATPTSRKTS